MRSDRRAILQLVAQGRITPGDAERLLLAWNDGREFRWIALGCLALAVMGEWTRHGVSLAGSSLLPTATVWAQHAMLMMHQVLGGLR